MQKLREWTITRLPTTYPLFRHKCSPRNIAKVLPLLFQCKLDILLGVHDPGRMVMRGLKSIVWLFMSKNIYHSLQKIAAGYLIENVVRPHGVLLAFRASTPANVIMLKTTQANSTLHHQYGFSKTSCVPLPGKQDKIPLRRKLCAVDRHGIFD